MQIKTENVAEILAKALIYLRKSVVEFSLHKLIFNLTFFVAFFKHLNKELKSLLVAVTTPERGSSEEVEVGSCGPKDQKLV